MVYIFLLFVTLTRKTLQPCIIIIFFTNEMLFVVDVVEDEEVEYASPPPVFLSYQWGHQDEVKLIRSHLQMAGYECWMDIGQMGGGDKLFEKIDSGIRGAKVIICCVSEKYAKSPNCNREVCTGIRGGSYNMLCIRKICQVSKLTER